MKTVTLTKIELMVAGLVGSMRSVSSMGRLVQKKYSNESQWQIDGDGAAAEMAFAKWMNVYYEPTVNTFKAPDVGVLQIRSTRHEHGKLIIRSKDVKDEAFVLVVNRVPEFDIVGWIQGSDAKQDKYLYDPNNINSPAWFVPQDALRPMEELGK